MEERELRGNGGTARSREAKETEIRTVNPPRKPNEGTPQNPPDKKEEKNK